MAHKSFSKQEPQADLHQTRASRGRRLSQPGVQLTAGRVKARGHIPGAELSMIERVVHLQAELNAYGFPQAGVLNRGYIPIVGSGAAQDSGGRVSNCAHLGRTENVRSEIALERPLAPG